MRLTLRIVATTLVAGLIGQSTAFAQQPPNKEAELKKAQEQLEILLKQLRDQEAKKPAPPTPAPPAVPAPPKVADPAKPMIFTVPAQPGNDSFAAIKGLLNSKDPKVAALAKELLDQLAKSAPKPMGGGQFQFQVVPSGGQFELKLEGQPKPVTPKPAPKPAAGLELQIEGLEFKLAPQPGAKPTETKGVVVVMGDASKIAGPSTLKLSAEGKTAAVLGGDGTVTIFDVASGKELMKFPGKK